MNSGRNTAFDCTRAICMLVIVGFYHMLGYLDLQLGSQARILAEIATAAALGAFTFLSAFFLSRKEIVNAGDICAFYKRRFLRIYPLFLLSSLSLYLVSVIWGGYFESLAQLLLTLTGLVCLFSPTPLTVWYVSMLLFFYLLTPIVLLLKNRKSQKWMGAVLVSAVLIVILILDAVGVLRVDNRFLALYLIYFCTLLFYDRISLTRRQTVAAGVAALIITAGSCIPYVNQIVLRWFPLRAILAAAGTVLLIWAGKQLDRIAPVSRLLQWISYASMTAYLFHRQFFGLAEKLFGKFSVPLALLLLIALLVLAWVTQRLYDMLIRKR